MDGVFSAVFAETSSIQRIELAAITSEVIEGVSAECRQTEQ
jgi:hypothetical protein